MKRKRKRKDRRDAGTSRRSTETRTAHGSSSDSHEDFTTKKNDVQLGTLASMLSMSKKERCRYANYLRQRAAEMRRHAEELRRQAVENAASVSGVVAADCEDDVWNQNFHSKT